MQLQWHAAGSAEGPAIHILLTPHHSTLELTAGRAVMFCVHMRLAVGGRASLEGRCGAGARPCMALWATSGYQRCGTAVATCNWRHSYLCGSAALACYNTRPFGGYSGEGCAQDLVSSGHHLGPRVAGLMVELTGSWLGPVPKLHVRLPPIPEFERIPCAEQSMQSAIPTLPKLPPQLICSHMALLRVQVALLSVLGQWMPALLWIVLQKLHEAALWLWRHTPGSWDRVPPQQQNTNSAHPLHADAAVAAGSLNDWSGQRVARVTSQPRQLSELDELLRVCESIGREQRELVS